MQINISNLNEKNQSAKKKISLFQIPQRLQLGCIFNRGSAFSLLHLFLHLWLQKTIEFKKTQGKFPKNKWKVYKIYILHLHKLKILFRIPQRRRPGAVYRDHEIFRNAIKTVHQYIEPPEKLDSKRKSCVLKRTRSGLIYGSFSDNEDNWWMDLKPKLHKF